MRVFEVFLNGERLCVAGMDGEGMVNAILSHFKSGARDGLALAVGASVGATGKHVTWAKVGLKLGDEIRVRILESDSADEPKARESREDQERDSLERNKEFVREMAKKWGWTLTEGPDSGGPA